MSSDRNGGGRVSVLFLLAPCNMDCPFCITEDEVELLSFDDAVATLERLRADGVDNVVLGGGEPLLWPHDVFRLARRAKKMGFTVQLGTNGIRLPEGFEHRPEIDRYVLPLDSTDPGLHDFLRPWRTSHFELVVDRLRHLREARKPTTISTVVTAKNHQGLPALGEFLRDLDPEGEWIHAWHLYRFLPFGRGGTIHAPELAIERDAYDAACRPVKQAGLPFAVYRRPNMLKAKTVDFNWLGEGGFRKWFRGRLREGTPARSDSASPRT